MGHLRKEKEYFYIDVYLYSFIYIGRINFAEGSMNRA